MARPTQQSLSYFSLDVDFFENRKVKKIVRACGPGSPALLLSLLCNIYRNKGYYILWDEDLPFDVADSVGASEGSVTEVINKALQVDFFYKPLYQKYKILTSPEIQSRYARICKDSKRVDWSIDKKFDLLRKKPPLPGEETPPSTPNNGHSKEEESTGKNSKEDNAAVPPIPTNFKKWTEQDFINSVSSFSEKFPYDLRNAFFRRWKEKSPTGLMRFQLEKTWDTKGRLETWAENDIKYNAEKKLINGNSNTGRQQSKSERVVAGQQQALDDLLSRNPGLLTGEGDNNA